MINAVLWILDRFQGLFRRLGADYPSLRAIVEMKLLMDTRRNRSTLGRSYKNANTSGRLWLLYAMNAFFSLFVGLLVSFIPSVMTGMTLLFTYLIVMVALTLITDYAELLLDTTDNAILLPRPVNSRTIWLSRLVHLIVYVSTLALSMALIPAGAAGYRFGLVADARRPAPRCAGRSPRGISDNPALPACGEVYERREAEGHHCLFAGGAVAVVYGRISDRSPADSPAVGEPDGRRPPYLAFSHAASLAGRCGGYGGKSRVYTGDTGCCSGWPSAYRPCYYG